MQYCVLRIDFISCPLVGYCICVAITAGIFGAVADTYQSLKQIFTILVIVFMSINGVYLLQNLIFYFVLNMPVCQETRRGLLRQWTQQQQQQAQIQQIQNYNNKVTKYNKKVRKYNRYFDNKDHPGQKPSKPSEGCSLRLCEGISYALISFILIFIVGSKIIKFICNQQFRNQMKQIRIQQIQAQSQIFNGQPNSTQRQYYANNPPPTSINQPNYTRYVVSPAYNNNINNYAYPNPNYNVYGTNYYPPNNNVVLVYNNRY